MVYDHYTAQADHPGAPLSEPSSNGQHDASDRQEVTPPENDWGTIGTFLQEWFASVSGSYELMAMPIDVRPSPLLAYADNAGAAIRLLHELADQQLMASYYIGLNPLKHLPKDRSHNTPFQRHKTRARESDVNRRHRLLIDFDAVKAGDGMATNEERQGALRARDVAQNLLGSLNWPDPVHVTSSGNGGDLIYAIDQAVSDATYRQVHGVLEGLDAHIRSLGLQAKVDTSVANADRVTKIPGTVVAKGAHTSERPWTTATSESTLRAARPVSADNLKAVSYLKHHEPEPAALAEMVAQVQRGLAAHNILVHKTKPWSKGGVLMDLEGCLLANPPHGSGGGRGYIIVSALGVTIKCHADRCQDKSLKGEDALKRLGIEVAPLIPRGTIGALPRVNAGLTAEAGAALVWEALAARAESSTPTLLAGQRGLVRLGWGVPPRVPESKKPKAADMAVVQLGVNPSSEVILAHELRRAVRFYEVKTQPGDVQVQVDCEPPSKVIKDMLGTAVPPLPRFEALQKAPLLLATGELLNKRGFHAESGTALNIGPEFENMVIPDRPTIEEARESLAYLKDLLYDFRLRDGWSKANALAFMLTPFARLVIDSFTPMALIEGPQPGVGKTRLGKLLFGPGAGRWGYNAFRNSEDVGKQLGNAFLAGEWLFGLDNVSGELANDELATVLTDDNAIVRLLHVNGGVAAPRTPAIVVTGNAFSLTEDLQHRSARISLTVREIDPTARTKFKHKDIWQFAMGPGRATIARHCLILLRHWFVAGCPPPSWSMPRFEQWSRVAYGTLQAAGWEERVDGNQGYRDGFDKFKKDADKGDRAAFYELVRRWWGVHGEESISTKQIDDLAEGAVSNVGPRIEGLARGKIEHDPTSRRRYFGQTLLWNMKDKHYPSLDENGQMTGEVELLRVNDGKTSGGTAWQLVPSQIDDDWVEPGVEPEGRPEPVGPTEPVEPQSKPPRDLLVTSHKKESSKTPISKSFLGSISPIGPMEYGAADVAPHAFGTFDGMLDSDDEEN